MKNLSFALTAFLLLTQFTFCSTQSPATEIEPLGAPNPQKTQVLHQNGESLRPLTREHLLTDTGKVMYDSLLYTMYAGKDELALTMTQDEYERAAKYLEAVLTGMFSESVLLPANNVPFGYWHHEYNPASGIFTLALPAQFYSELPRYREKHDEALSAARLLLEDIVPEGTGDYEAAYIIYRHVISNVNYSLMRDGEQGVSACTAWDALVRGQAQCEGYAKAIVMLYSLYGIETSVVTSCGIGDEPGHAWTVALLDGEYYYIDATNAGGSEPGPNAPPDLHDYGFCMTDAYMQTLSSYDYDSARTPAFGELVRLRNVLPPNTGRHLQKSPYYVPDADLTDGHGADEIRAAFADARESGRNWIWILGMREKLEATGLLKYNGDGTFAQRIMDYVPEGKHLHWEWMEDISKIYLTID